MVHAFGRLLFVGSFGGFVGEPICCMETAGTSGLELHDVGYVY